MNRRARRAVNSQGKKPSRDATREEILPAGHGPVQQGLVDTMTNVVKILSSHLGENYDVTLFVAERLPADGADRLPRFNYISTAARPDMIAVLDAFAAKQKEIGPTLDKIDDAPPTGTAQ